MWSRHSRYLNVTDGQTDKQTGERTDDILWDNRALWFFTALCAASRDKVRILMHSPAHLTNATRHDISPYTRRTQHFVGGFVRVALLVYIYIIYRWVEWMKRAQINFLCAVSKVSDGWMISHTGGAVIPGGSEANVGCSVSFDCVYRRRHANTSSIDSSPTADCVTSLWRQIESVIAASVAEAKRLDCCLA